MRGPSLINWTGEFLCNVGLEFELDGALHFVQRTQDPNSLSLQVGENEPRVVTQDEVDALVGIDYQCFLYCALMGQFNPFFFDLPASEKLELFSTVLRLDAWQQLSDAARARATTTQETLDDEQRHLAHAEGQLQAVRKTHLDLERSAAAFEKDLRAAMKANAAELKEARRDLKRYEERLERVQAEEEARIAEAEDLRKRIDAAKSELLAKRRADMEADVAFRPAQGRASELRNQIARIEKLGVTCEYCGQEVDEKHRGRFLDGLRNAHAEQKRIVSEKKAAADQTREAVLVGMREVARLEEEEKGILEACGRLTDEVSRRQRERNARSDRCKGLELRGEQLEASTNPYRKQLAENAAEFTRLEREIERLSNSVADRKVSVDAYSYWVRGFKDLRLWLIQQALTQLEVQVNNALIELGLLGFRVTFDVERPKADGGLSRGFSVFVTGPGQDKPVPWETWSGGETQRLRIAGAIGLANLISSRRGVRCGFEVWDEPTAHLAQEGVVDLLSYFAARARAERKQIYLVDHRTLAAGEFDDEFMVVKDETGSHIIQSDPRAERKGYSHPSPVRLARERELRQVT